MSNKISTSTWQWILGSLTVLALAITGVIIYKSWKFKKTDKKVSSEEEAIKAIYGKDTPVKTTTKEHTPGKQTTGSVMIIGLDKVLSKGSKGYEVSKLQEMANKSGRISPLLDTKGTYGPKTEAAVKLLTGKTSTTLREFTTLVHLVNPFSTD